MTDREIEHVNIVIVGGGVSGLLVANMLEKLGHDFLGLERDDVLGGRIVVGHHRIYSETSVQFFKRLAPQIPWNLHESSPFLRKKGDWEELLSETDSQEDEKFYFGHRFYAPAIPNSEIVSSLSGTVEKKFRTQHTVNSISIDDKTLSCLNGSKFKFEKLFWCNSLGGLNRIWSGDRTPLQKLMKKGSSARGGVTLEWQVTQPIVPHNNTIVVPFRLKEHKLRALGIQENTSEGGLVFRVILFLDDEILEDKEEVAKCVRALRRELEKELGDFKNLVISEKLAFLPELSGEKSAEAESLEIVPGVFYVGPQISVGSDEEGGQNLDLIARNCEVVGRLPMFTSA